VAVLLAGDTNFHLHYRSINELHPSDHRADAEAWVVAATVLAELDDLEHKPVEQKTRERAKDAKQLLGKVIEGGDLLKTGVAVHHAPRPLDYAAVNVNSAVPDECILGDLIRYRNEHPGDEIVVVSHDLSMRLATRGHGLNPIDPPNDFRVKDVPTTTERRLAKAETRVRELEDAAPRLTLAFTQNHRLDKDFAVCAALPDDLIDEIINGIQPDPNNRPVLPTPRHQYQLNHAYDKEFKEYCSELRSYVIEYDRYVHRVIQLDFALSNSGLVRAENVEVQLSSPPVGTLHHRLSEPADPPGPPTRYTYASTTDLFRLAQKSGPAAVLPSLYSQQRARRNSAEPNVTNTWDGQIIYSNAAVPQHEEVILPSIFLVLADGFWGKSMPIDYRIRAGNSPGQIKGRLRLRLTWNPPDKSDLPDFNSLQYRLRAANRKQSRAKI
jgi:hypothetical protein